MLGQDVPIFFVEKIAIPENENKKLRIREFSELRWEGFLGTR
jgi:hypothetical protein